MAILFTTNKKDLRLFFKPLSEEDIQDCCESKVYYRGEEYYEADLVTEAAFNEDKSLLTATVKGRERYIVKISLKGGDISGQCTCLYGGICKHIIAVLLHTIDQIDNIEIEHNVNEPDVKKQLQTLSKNELIDLVIKYAPRQYFVEIKNRSAKNTDVQNIFRKVEHSIQNIFADRDLLDSPTEFDSALVKELKKLSGLETKLQEEPGKLIFHIIREKKGIRGKARCI